MSPPLRSRRAAAGRLALLLVAAGVPLQAQTGPTLGPEHERLQGLAGEWTVVVDGEAAGRATGRTRLQGQFVELRIDAEAGPVRSALYTFGFDDRHGRWTVIAMDETGTYWVTAAGVAREGDPITMYGTDDDPVLAEMGIEKEFVIELTFTGADSARIETRLIDNRTEERRELPFFGFDLHRGG